ncbi:MAG: bifunctional chorismate mutase/prephenate dehydrogenase [Kangiellaceae bacterium]|nr:bifunctional chorismate mutase/prephenate dehydrogenase [Kangiellaceae bacterium]MCW8999607.1 bifunctional chorismate mutase/prephenate dehydrogenase [Kangiellaceae bacterium]MCW9018564.1 bifunctional chorismate mutase/prephenate dehydrogenase [Kangiellaceae bacterium]
MKDSEFQSLTLEQVNEQLEHLLERKTQLLKLEKEKRIKSQCEVSRRIVVIGGKGLLGKRFVEVFNQAGHKTSVLEKDDWPQSAEMLSQANLVVVAVPIHLTEAVIAQLDNLPEDCILADITSVKQMPVQKMLEVHVGPVVGMHPMFGPDVEDFCDQTVVVCEGRDSEKFRWLIELLQRQKAKLHFVSALEHDQTMAIVQVLRHFSTVAYGVHLAEEDGRLQDILAMSSPIYRLELAMVGRLFAQSPDLYTEIIFSNPKNVSMMRRFISRFEHLLGLIENKNKAEFKDAFMQTREWFGEYANKFLVESGQMLAAAHSVSSESDE